MDARAHGQAEAVERVQLAPAADRRRRRVQAGAGELEDDRVGTVRRVGRGAAVGA